LIVTCEQCSTQFHLDDAKVPPGGARVRCSRCKHAFFIAPGGEEPELGSLDRAAQDALDAEAPPPPEPSQDLSAPAESSSDLAASEADLASDLDDGEDLASESDWEFNREASEPGPSADARDAAREAIDDLLGSRTPESSLAAPASSLAAPASAPVEDEDLGSPESWDLLGDDDAAPSAPSEQQGADAEIHREPAAARFKLPAAPVAEWTPRREPSRVLAWIANTGHAIGWSVTALLFAIVAILTLSPVSARDAEAQFGRQRVAGLEAQGISGRWVENAVAGSLYVVSGRLVNPTGQAAALGTRIGVRLLDANGVRLPIELAAAGPVLEERVLRESDPAGIQTRQSEAGLALAAAVIPPGQSLPFEAVVRELPLAASRFLLEPLAPARAQAAPATSAP
jgi:predicted Zn finger-like uncharacterized protein